MSLGGGGPPVESCSTTTDAEHKAICRSSDAGVTYVVAAGNEGWDFDYEPAPDTPAAYPEVLTVTAASDSDGLPGAAGPTPSCRSGEARRQVRELLQLRRHARWRGSHDRRARGVHQVHLERRRLQHDLRHQHGGTARRRRRRPVPERGRHERALLRPAGPGHPTDAHPGRAAHRRQRSASASPATPPTRCRASTSGTSTGSGSPPNDRLRECHHDLHRQRPHHERHEPTAPERRRQRLLRGELDDLWHPGHGVARPLPRRARRPRQPCRHLPWEKLPQLHADPFDLGLDRQLARRRMA